VSAAAQFLVLVALCSSALLGGALLLTRRITAVRWRETIWKVALSASLLLPLSQLVPVQRKEQLATVMVKLTDPAILPALGITPRSLRESVVASSGVVTMRQLGFIACGILGLGTLLVLLELWRGQVALRRMQRASVRDTALLARANQIGSELGSTRAIRLTESSSVTVPLTLSRAEICLPTTTRDSLDAAQLDAILAHEIAHIVRRDLAWQSFAIFSARLFFFQPLFAIARRELSALFEFAADDLAVQATQNRKGLVEGLLHYARALEPTHAAGLPFTGTSQFMRRVQRILSGADHSTRPAAPALLLGGVLTLLLFAPLQSLPRVAREPVVREVVKRGHTSTPQLRQPALRISQDNGAERRELEVTRDAKGEARYSYRVNGQPADFTPAARRWAQQLLNP
jgi:beta-lactamase regulating signal transducer with metallopeptidase domain